MEAIDEWDDGGLSVVSLSGELDASDPTWADAIDSALDAGKTRLVIDLTNVTFIDSSVVKALILTHSRVGDQGWVRLVYTHHLIARVISICGLEDRFPQFTTMDAAVRSAPTRAAMRRTEAAYAEVRELQLQTETPGGGDHDTR